MKGTEGKDSRKERKGKKRKESDGKGRKAKEDRKMKEGWKEGR